ncbi:LysR substrate-binding domain-containing protein [Spelaeicoccus albus]|uniref:DNA-binding transcriptional LysR family regulator n=1 Tax=Spelaeicoccus albus TaxID=1280376 RepID=A0A7Z0D4S8_9MICO|nr:LysR substrate-binding domain-containing protein [Spelaeicoccus albus]NYI68806.1 DNA-binding transcriptional LysR family regulator [Spelaeicoccus albus]
MSNIFLFPNQDFERIVRFMELRHLRYFLAVAEDLNFTRAAAKLQMAQPPLSQQIVKLERELGTALFDRTSRTVRLTPAGSALAHEAQALLERAERSVEFVQQVGAGNRGVLRIGAVASAFSGILLDAIPEYRRRHPGVFIVPHDMEATPQIEALINHTIDIGFFRSTQSPNGVVTRTVEKEALVAALPTTHRAASDESVQPEKLAHEPFVLFARNNAPEAFDTIIAACTAAGFTPKITFEASNDHSLISLVATGFGVSIVPRSTSLLSLPGVTYRPLTTPTAQTPMSVGLPETGVSPQAKQMLAILKDRSERL